MKKIVSHVLLLFSFSCLSLPATAQNNPTYSKEIEARISLVERSLGEAIKTDDKPVLLADRMKFYNVPGVTIAVIKDFKLEWARGYGYADKEQKIPVNTQTLFQAASISKSLNAVGVLKLAQTGKVNLDADINTYLKSWKFPYDTTKGKKTITLRALLSHTAGTSVHGFRGYASHETIPTITQVLDGQKPANSAAVRSLFDAGLKFQYSGGGTTITQLVIMDVTGMDYDDYARETVLQPLGMTSSFYTVPVPADKRALVATAYRDDGNEVPGKYHAYPEQAAAALWTNPTDLSKYIIEISLAAADRSSKVLDKEHARLMLSPVMNDVALGTFIRKAGEERYFSHGGANEGFRCTYYGDPLKGNGVVVMVNSDNGTILNEIVNSVATVYNWKDFYKPKIRTVAQVPRETLDKYVGKYVVNLQFDITIRREGDRLKATRIGESELNLFAQSQTRFFLKEIPTELEFVSNDAGEVNQVILHQNGRSTNGFRVK